MANRGGRGKTQELPKDWEDEYHKLRTQHDDIKTKYNSTTADLRDEKDVESLSSQISRLKTQTDKTSLIYTTQVTYGDYEWA